MRFFRLTTEEFSRALDRAAKNDERQPLLKHHAWLIEHSEVRDGEVILRVACDRPTIAIVNQ